MRRLILVAALLLTSCFEPVVEESLRLQFNGEGMLIVTATTKMASRDLAPDHAVSERLRQLRDEAERGDDFWGRQIEQLDPEDKQVVFDYHKRMLVGVSRSAAFAEPNVVESLFRSFGAGAFVRRHENMMTVEIYPSRPTRATEEQRKIARRAMDTTTEAFASYLAAAQRVYAYLEEHPDRSSDLFATLFETKDDELEEIEKTLVTGLPERMDQVTRVFELHESQPYTLDELSRLVFNPFPAETSIEIAGSVDEMVGFEAVAANRYKIPTLGLWGALAGLEGKWISPDPLVAHVNLKTGGEGTPEATAERFATQARTYAANPRAAEILRALEARLAPASIYRLRWRLPEPTPETKK